MFADKEVEQVLTASVENIGTSVNSGTTTNLFANLLMKGSMQQLWETIRAL
jgi:hypothetical protein